MACNVFAARARRSSRDPHDRIRVAHRRRHRRHVHRPRARRRGWRGSRVQGADRSVRSCAGRVRCRAGSGAWNRLPGPRVAEQHGALRPRFDDCDEHCARAQRRESRHTRHRRLSRCTRNPPRVARQPVGSSDALPAGAGPALSAPADRRADRSQRRCIAPTAERRDRSRGERIPARKRRRNRHRVLQQLSERHTRSRSGARARGTLAR